MAEGGVRLPASDGSAAPSHGRWRSIFRRWSTASVAVLVLLLGIGTFIEVGHLVRYRKFSPIDELQHVDYVVRAPLLDFPGSGSRVGQEAARAETCSRIDSPADSGIMACVIAPDQVDVTKLQEAGYNTAYIHPPIYYLVNGLVHRAQVAVSGDSIGTLTSARLGNLLWVWAAIVFLWLLLAELGASLWVRAGLIVVVISAPTFLHAVGAVNPDASAVAVGAAVLWAAVRWERSSTRSNFVLVTALALVATLTKVTNLFAVGVAVVYLVWPVLDPFFRMVVRRQSVAALERKELRRRLAVAGAMVSAVMVGAIGFRILQSVLQEIPPSQLPMAVPTIVHAFPVTGFFPAWHVGVSPLQSAYLPPFLQTTWMRAIPSLIDMAVMVGAVVGTVVAPPGSRGRRLGLTALGFAVAAGPAIVAFNYFVSGVYVPIPSRYALSLVPALVAAAVPALRSRWIGRATVALAVVAFLPVAWAIVAPASA